MKPYYEHAGITIYHGDCREMLWDAEAISLVLTDPPYGIRLESHRGSDWGITGDDDGELGTFVLNWLSSIPTIVFASPRRPWPGNWKQWLVWDKGGAVGGGGDPDTHWKFTWELIQVRGLRQLNGERDNAVLRHYVTPAGFVNHQNEKPLSLITYLIAKASREGQLIIDPFMGSGTTLRAAKDLGRRAIGIEIEEKYCEIAAKRLSQEVLSFQS